MNETIGKVEISAFQFANLVKDATVLEALCRAIERTKPYEYAIYKDILGERIAELGE